MLGPVVMLFGGGFQFEKLKNECATKGMFFVWTFPPEEDTSFVM